MASSREFPERPIVGVGGVVIEDGHALLIRRGTEPLLGEWSIPGGTLELGETLEAGVARELSEETGVVVRVLGLIEVFDRIFTPEGNISSEKEMRPKYHFVIADYLCERISGEAKASSDVTDVSWARQEVLPQYRMTGTAMRILRKAFEMDRARRGKAG